MVISMNTFLTFITMLHSVSLHMLTNVTISLHYFNLTNLIYIQLLITFSLISIHQFNQSSFLNLCFYYFFLQFFKVRLNFLLSYLNYLFVYLLFVESHKQTLILLIHCPFQLNPSQYQCQLIITLNRFIANYCQQIQHFKEK